MKDILIEASIVDLADDALKEFLGGTYDQLKTLEEAKKNDQEIKILKDRLRDYTDREYNDTIKSLKADLKAARRQAKLRGIEWHMPERKL